MKSSNQKTLVLDLTLTRGLVIGLAVVMIIAGLGGYLTWGRQDAAASSPPAPLAASADMRQFYLSGSGNSGAQALNACASGYHTASLWEIIDPSNLKYDTSRGTTLADSGSGPPAMPVGGWVRTGHESRTSNLAGQANCAAWTSASGTDYGTYLALPYDWTQAGGGGWANFNIWYAGTSTCDYSARVWCVED